MPHLNQCLSFSLLQTFQASSWAKEDWHAPISETVLPQRVHKYYRSKTCNISYFCKEPGNAFSFLFCILYFTSFELKHNDLPWPYLKTRLYSSKHVDSSVTLHLNVRRSSDTDGGVHCLFWKSSLKLPAAIPSKYGAVFSAQLRSASNPKGIQN